MRASFGLPLALALALGACASPTPTWTFAREEPTARVASPSIDDGRADAVFGQPDLTSGAAPTVVSVATLSAPAGLAADPRFSLAIDALWIAEPSANRVRALHAPAFTPYELHGQPTYDELAPNGGGVGPTQGGLDGPLAVAASGDTGEWAVADTNNHRVVRGYFGAQPRLVYGQRGSFATNTPNEGGIGQATLAEPKGVALVGGYLFVADAGNHRVLMFYSGSTYAAWVFGQSGFAAGAPNRGLAAPSTNTLADPHGLAIAETGVSTSPYTLWIADTGNHRVLSLPWQSSAATWTIGGGGPGVGARRLNGPTAVAPDPQRGVWIADTGNHRVLHFPRGAGTADRVLGQPDFDHDVAPASPGPSALLAPTGVAVGADGALYVADTGFHRVLRFSFACAGDAACEDGDPCTDDRCVGGACTRELTSASSACAPYKCDLTSRACRTQCFSNFDCNPLFECADNEKFTELAGRCVRGCAVDADCANATTRPFCSHGLCCDARCSGTCESCDEPWSPGTCLTVAGQPRHGECPGADRECAGRCNGLDGARCTLAQAGESCGVEGCLNGVERRPGTCDGVGACRATVRACGAYGCVPAGCRTACAHDGECAAGAYCEAGACLFGPLFPQGGGCAAGAGDDASPLGALGAALAAPALAALARRTRRRRSAPARRADARSGA